jgi:predicted cupin superfamily sugar epimerase
MSRKEFLIKKLDLKTHPEGGFYKETYRCAQGLQRTDINTFRCFSTAIFYLLGKDDFSRFHRIKSDELWHHYEGGSLTIHLIHDDGKYEALYLGKNLDNGEIMQLVVPANTWFAATVNHGSEYVLVGCTVSPGFDFDDFEMADRHKMKQAFPEHSVLINELT